MCFNSGAVRSSHRAGEPSFRTIDGDQAIDEVALEIFMSLRMHQDHGRASHEFDGGKSYELWLSRTRVVEAVDRVAWNESTSAPDGLADLSKLDEHGAPGRRSEFYGVPQIRRCRSSNRSAMAWASRVRSLSHRDGGATITETFPVQIFGHGGLQEGQRRLGRCGAPDGAAIG